MEFTETDWRRRHSFSLFAFSVHVVQQFKRNAEKKNKTNQQKKLNILDEQKIKASKISIADRDYFNGDDTPQLLKKWILKIT